MALPRLHLQVATLIGGNTRIVREKDMEHMSGLMETDTLGSTCRMSNTAMEYSHGQMELYIKDKTNKVKEKVMDITGGQMAMNTAETGRIT